MQKIYKGEIQRLMPIFQAMADGRIIHFSANGNDWTEMKEIGFWNNIEYRIKPEPKYRPFKNAEECWQEMQKHQPFGWVKLKDTESGYYMLKGIASQVVIGFNETPFSYKRVFEDYTFADELTFGIKVEEE